MSHPDTPYIISLVKFKNENNDDDGNNDDYTTCTLLDHIPHNNEYTPLAVGVPKPGCTMSGRDDDVVRNPDVDGTGSCGSDYYVTVNIPDVTCENCGLVLLNPQGARAGQRCYHRVSVVSPSRLDPSGLGGRARGIDPLGVFRADSAPPPIPSGVRADDAQQRWRR